MLLVVLNSDWFGLSRRFKACGIETEVLEVNGNDDEETCRSYIQENAWYRVARRIKRGDLPELIIFADDYVANGGLFALAEAGLSSPRDIKTIVWSCRGALPICSHQMTRMEISPFACGRSIGELLVAYLRSGQCPSKVTLGYEYVVGPSFPE